MKSLRCGYIPHIALMRRIGRLAGTTLLLTSGNAGGVMRIIPGIIIPAILALGVAGSILSGAGMSVAATHAPSAHAHVAAAAAIPAMKYHS